MEENGEEDDTGQEEEEEASDSLLLPRQAKLCLQIPSSSVIVTNNDNFISETVSLLSPQERPPPTFSSCPLRTDHKKRPIWVGEDGHILVESMHEIHTIAQDFLTAIAEPISRPKHIHEYKLTPYSLYAAVSVGLSGDSIVKTLGLLSKNSVPQEIANFIRSCTLSYGKVKLVMQNGRYWIESKHMDVLHLLLADPLISSSRIDTTTDSNYASSKLQQSAGTLTGNVKQIPKALTSSHGIMKHFQEVDERMDDWEDGIGGGESHSFEILSTSVEQCKKACILLDYPMLEEYDFRRDLHNPTLPLQLRTGISIRPYQEASLSKMFGNGRARSGIIVLPCGAGKTLVGITAACTTQKSCLVLCTSGVAVEQWKQQFLQYSTIDPKAISRFTSDHKECNIVPGAGHVVVSTYSMIAYGGRRSFDARKMMDLIRQHEWGLLILDEVHVVPAQMFRKVLTTVAAHCKLGLTATLVREDDKIDDLNFLIGPKLYEANWLDLAKQGHIASVQCAEVWCSMPSTWYREYLTGGMSLDGSTGTGFGSVGANGGGGGGGSNKRVKRLLSVMNPSKFHACQYLIDYHERRGDKIIVFSDNVYSLKAYAIKMKKPHIYGETGQQERMKVLSLFQNSSLVNTIFLSKVGDTSIDLPEATCLIQISSHYGSRRQEAQRLGRILRAKKRSEDGFNAFFYTLVSQDTEEMYYSTKRQQFLVDQGYSFKVITDLTRNVDHDFHYSTPKEQMELLQTVIMSTEADDEDGDDNDDNDDEEGIRDASGGKDSIGVIRKKNSSLTSLSGGDGMAYIEYNKAMTSQTIQAKRGRHHLFKKQFGS